jgi:hypothetical protein
VVFSGTGISPVVGLQGPISFFAFGEMTGQTPVPLKKARDNKPVAHVT